MGLGRGRVIRLRVADGGFRVHGHPRCDVHLHSGVSDRTRATVGANDDPARCVRHRRLVPVPDNYLGVADLPTGAERVGVLRLPPDAATVQEPLRLCLRGNRREIHLNQCVLNVAPFAGKTKLGPHIVAEDAALDLDRARGRGGVKTVVLELLQPTVDEPEGPLVATGGDEHTATGRAFELRALRGDELLDEAETVGVCDPRSEREPTAVVAATDHFERFEVEPIPGPEIEPRRTVLGGDVPVDIAIEKRANVRYRNVAVPVGPARKDERDVIAGSTETETAVAIERHGLVEQVSPVRELEEHAVGGVLHDRSVAGLLTGRVTAGVLDHVHGFLELDPRGLRGGRSGRGGGRSRCTDRRNPG